MGATGGGTGAGGASVRRRRGVGPTSALAAQAPRGTRTAAPAARTGAEASHAPSLTLSSPAGPETRPGGTHPRARIVRAWRSCWAWWTACAASGRAVSPCEAGSAANSSTTRTPTSRRWGCGRGSARRPSPFCAPTRPPACTPGWGGRRSTRASRATARGRQASGRRWRGGSTTRR
jgi:hypothetical protein